MMLKIFLYLQFLHIIFAHNMLISKSISKACIIKLISIQNVDLLTIHLFCIWTLSPCLFVVCCWTTIRATDCISIKSNWIVEIDYNQKHRVDMCASPCNANAIHLLRRNWRRKKRQKLYKSREEKALSLCVFPIYWWVKELCT